MNRTLRTVPTLVLAVAVVLLSIAGSATAAKLITGKQIKNSSIASVDIKNGTVSSKDVKNGSVTGTDLKDDSVTTADLANEAVGKDEIEKSARTLSSFNSEEDVAFGTCAGPVTSCLPAVGVALTSGYWVVTGTLTVHNAAPLEGNLESCALVNSGLAHSTAQFRLNTANEPNDRTTLSLQAQIFSPNDLGTISIRCTESAGVLFGEDVTLSAVKVTV